MSTEVSTTTKTTVTTTERIATVGMVVSLLALILFFVYPNLAPTLKSSNDIQSAATTLVIIVLAAAVLGLIGAALGVPAFLRGRSLGRGTTAGVAVVVLLAAAITFLVSVLPHVQNLQYLQNTVEPFGTSIQ